MSAGTRRHRGGAAAQAIGPTAMRSSPDVACALIVPRFAGAIVSRDGYHRYHNLADRRRHRGRREAARRRRGPNAAVQSPVLDERLGARVFLKAETLQRTGSFKFRGAYNKISSIPPEKRAGRRGGVFVRQSRAGRGGGRAAARHAGGHRDAGRCAEARSASAPRRSAPRSCSTTATRRIARRSRAKIVAEARRDAGAAVRRSDDHRRAGHDRRARSSRIWPRWGSRRTSWWSALPAAGWSPASRSA